MCAKLKPRTLFFELPCWLWKGDRFFECNYNFDCSDCETHGGFVEKMFCVLASQTLVLFCGQKQKYCIRFKKSCIRFSLSVVLCIYQPMHCVFAWISSIRISFSLCSPKDGYDMYPKALGTSIPTKQFFCHSTLSRYDTVSTFSSLTTKLSFISPCG